MSDLLLPAENMALTVARAQVERGDNPTPNISAVLVMTIDRLIDKFGDRVLYEKVRHCGEYICGTPETLVQVYPDVTT